MKYNVIDYDVSLIQQKYQVNEMVAKALVYNHLEDWQIQQVLAPTLQYQINEAPALLKACDRIKQAQRNHEKVFIAGDYDADGICATTIMKNTLDLLKIENGYYIPDRFKDGYGLNPKIVQMVKDKGYDLIITVDNGIKAFEALQLAKQLDIEVIVTDHHIYDEEVDALVVHPDLMAKGFKGLCGAGVALQVARVLIGENDINDVLAMVATIGDIMELFNENRTIVRKGLQKIDHCLPIKALLPNKQGINAQDIAFNVVPKLNSIARLDDESNANVLVKYLLCQDPATINNVAKQIEAVNNKRKNISSKMASEAMNKVNDDAFIVIEDDDFSEGIVGLVAGKIAKEYNKPCLVLTSVDDTYKGSGRSIKGFDMHAFFKDFDLASFGGHAQAVGLSVKKAQFAAFKDLIKKKMADVKITDTLEEAISLNSAQITLDNLSAFDRLEPFGQGFKKPLFYIDDHKIAKVDLLKEKYLKFNFHQGYEAICFNSRYKQIKNPNYIIGNLEINEFRAQKNCCINIVDME
ncbi:MAG: DHH family phosphoesterase [Erysipelotrichaceae bacterium]|nr:DHH family phosphoesterase [Erysipelotrichaceae bacterium]MDY5252462.1 DHH family phosphoesterase [Erysipelotrichaceae bacterium]